MTTGINSSSARRDPFRALAIAAIVLGLAIVLFAVVFWAVTRRESSLLVGAGLTLSIGGGLRNYLAGIAERVPDYEAPRESPDPPDPPVPPARERRGRG